jgi:hypothetical protein
MRRAFLGVLPVLLTACSSSSTKASTGRTQHEADSVIANSQVPGAAVAKKALDIADSSRHRVAAQDSAAQAP